MLPEIYDNVQEEAQNAVIITGFSNVLQSANMGYFY